MSSRGARHNITERYKGRAKLQLPSSVMLLHDTTLITEAHPTLKDAIGREIISEISAGLAVNANLAVYEFAALFYAAEHHQGKASVHLSGIEELADMHTGMIRELAARTICKIAQSKGVFVPALDVPSNSLEAVLKKLMTSSGFENTRSLIAAYEKVRSFDFTKRKPAPK